jgi:hypothetical protein
MMVLGIFDYVHLAGEYLVTALTADLVGPSAIGQALSLDAQPATALGALLEGFGEGVKH